MISRIPLLVAACGILWSGSLTKAGEGETNWPWWRGPNGDGCAPAVNLPAKWDAKNILWKTPLPGKGHSTPIIWGERIFLTAPEQGRVAVLAFDRKSGKRLWETLLGPERPGKHADATGCNPSPVTDGQSVFAYFKSGVLAGLDLDGRIRWQINIQERFGKDTLFWDIASSPALTEKNVVLAVLQSGNSFVAAFDKLTGEMRWKVDRNYEKPNETHQGYATPRVVQHQGREAVLVWGANHLTAHDAADGQVVWSCGGFNPENGTLWAAIPTPVLAQNVILINEGRGTSLHGIRWDGAGDVTATNRLWRRKDTGTFVTTPAVSAQGLAYILRDDKLQAGIVDCLDPLTGATRWTGQLAVDKSRFYASPLLVGGKLIVVRLDGTVFVLRAEGPFEILAENAMGERIAASPIASGGCLFLRGEEHLFCLGTAVDVGPCP